jgi:uncharacterized protein (DUF362 family)/NAD-dependent dihydropyrimidine dehydrogenase PreA subunit
MSIVSLVKTDDYSNIKEDIKKSLDLIGGLDKFIRPGQKVLLKPNLFGTKASEYAVTNKEFLRAVIHLVKEAQGVPIIGEFIASDMPGINRIAFKELGIIKLAIEEKVKIIDFQSKQFVKTIVPNPLVMDSVDVAEAVLDAPLVINLPKFKGHACTYVTGAIKNCFGCITGRGDIHKNYPDDDFSKAVVDAFSTMKFHLNIMDAVIGMDGDEAPAYGEPCKIGYVITSTDAVSADAVACKITGHKLNQIPMLVYAHKQKLGTAKLSEIELVGDSPEPREFNFHGNYRKRISCLGSEAKVIETKSEAAYPEINIEDCIKCLACLNNCPADAIHETSEGLKIDHEKCVRCYRCLEVCPMKAVKLNK